MQFCATENFTEVPLPQAFLAFPRVKSTLLPMECSTTELRQHARYLRGIGPKWPPTRRPVLATRAQARGQAGKGPKSSKSCACCRQASSKAGQTAGPARFPIILGLHSNRRIMTSHGLAAARGIAASGVETHYARVTAQRTTRCRAQSRHIRRTDDEGRSRQACGTERRGCEGFTTRSAEACVARKSQATEVAGARARRGERIFRNRRCLPRYRQQKAVAYSAAGNPVPLVGCMARSLQSSVSFV